jgi:signal transduction histidine kinase
MVGFAGLLLRAEGHAEPQAVAQRILNAGRRAEALIDDLLSFARLGDAKLVKVSVDLGLVVERARAGLNASGRQPQVQWQLGALPTVQGDASLLEQVFANLLGNALKFSAGCDPTCIEVGSRQLASGGHEIWVRDNGAGFDPAFADGLFTPFHRLHSLREFAGTGMGLANVRRIVERHGGHVSALGSPGQGATFTLTLPD